MRKLIIVAYLICSVNLMAQSPTTHRSGKSLFIEAGGPGGFTANYDMRFTKKSSGLGGRLGMGWNLLNTDEHSITGIYVPVEINQFIPVKSYGIIELGAGMLYRVRSYKNKTSLIDSSSSTAAPYLDIAIRYTPPYKRIFFRLAYTPVWMEKEETHIGTLRVGDLQWDWGIGIGLRLGRVTRKKS